MAIKFLEDYSTQAVPPEVFTAGQVVEDRDEASEGHFVSRGRAAYLRDGKLIDRFGAEIPDPFPETVRQFVDYVKDKLAKLALTAASIEQLRAIAEYEHAEIPQGTEVTAAELIKVIEEKRAEPDYVRDKLAKLDLSKANEQQLRLIATTEIGATIKVEDADVAVADATDAQLVAAIEAKRKG